MYAERGFTLVEAMVTLAVIGICTAVGVPALRDFTQQQRASGAMHRLGSQIAAARVAAITHSRDSIVCPLATPTSCATDPDWSDGWIAFFDTDGNRRPDSVADVLHVDQTGGPGGLQIGTTSGRSYIRFRPDGLSPGTNVSLRFCDPEQGLLGSLIVNNAGRTRSERPEAATTCPL